MRGGTTDIRICPLQKTGVGVDILWASLSGSYYANHVFVRVEPDIAGMVRGGGDPGDERS